MTIRQTLERLWGEHYNFSEFDGKYHVEDIKGFFDSALTSIASEIEGMKKPVPEMITTDYLKKIGVEEAALLLHRRSGVLGWNEAISDIAQKIRGGE